MWQLDQWIQRELELCAARKKNTNTTVSTSSDEEVIACEVCGVWGCEVCGADCVEDSDFERKNE